MRTSRFQARSSTSFSIPHTAFLVSSIVSIEVALFGGGANYPFVFSTRQEQLS
jgi:hypothetical protein